MKEPSISREKAVELLKSRSIEATEEELFYCTWPHPYGSTAGPFGGIGGQMVTMFQLEAWAFGPWGVVFCGDKIISVGNFQIGAKW